MVSANRVYLFTALLLLALWGGLAFLVLDQWKEPGDSQGTAGMALEEWSSFFRIPGVKLFTYRVPAGESFPQLARKFQVSEEALRSLNQMNSAAPLPPGTTLLVPSRDGLYHMVRPGQGLSDISKAYAVPLGDLLKANRKRGDGDLQDGEILYLPGGQYLSTLDRRWVFLESLRTPKGFQKPTTGRFADGFGERLHPITGKKSFHWGLDLAPGQGARVLAAQTGTVSFAGIRAGYGRLVILDHGEGLTSWYAHLSKILVKPRQVVRRGTLIGKVGQSGMATGPHLHFEVRSNEKPQNPLLYLEK